MTGRKVLGAHVIVASVDDEGFFFVQTQNLRAGDDAPEWASPGVLCDRVAAAAEILRAAHALVDVLLAERTADTITQICERRGGVTIAGQRRPFTRGRRAEVKP
jgi:hypothetical protein